MAALVGPACLPASELALSAHTIINVTVPAAMAAVMGLEPAAEAARRAEAASFLTAAFPGARIRAQEAAERALSIAQALNQSEGSAE